MFRYAALQARRRSDGELILVQSLPAWMFTMLALLIVLIALFVLFNGEFGRSQTLRGVLVPSRGLIKLYPDSPLTVMEVLCKEGDRVEKGATLIRLASHRIASSVGNADTLRLSLLDERLSLERRKIAAADLAFDARKIQLQRRIEGATRQLHEITIQSSQQATLAESASREFSRLRGLLDSKLISDAEYEQRRRSKLSNEAALQTTRGSVAQLNNQIQGLRAEHDAIKAQFAVDRLKMQSELLSLEAQRVGLGEQIDVSIVAPRSAVVQGVHTDSGQRVTPQRPLLTLFPADATLEAELYVPGRALASVRVAQGIKIKYDAFPFEKFGGYPATISHVSYTLVRPDELDTPLLLREPVYRVTASLADLALENQSQAFALQPGMTFSTSIISERRTLIEWLLQPLKRVADVYWGWAATRVPAKAWEGELAQSPGSVT